MTNSDLLRMLNGNVRHFEHADDAIVSAPIGSNKTGLASLKGNPPFVGQFNINVKLRYFTVAAGAFTLRNAAYVLANAAALATRLGLIVFSKTDFAAGWKKSIQNLPLDTWVYGTPFVYKGAGQYPVTAFGVVDATAAAQLVQGDIVFPITAVSGGVNYCALVIARCDEVALGTLQDSLGSDMITINNIRYTLTDTSNAGLTQYQNQLYLQSQTLLGKFNSDIVPVNAMKNPEQFQNGIVDVPIEKTIDKNTGFSTYVNYDQENSMSLGFFLSALNKLAA